MSHTMCRKPYFNTALMRELKHHTLVIAWGIRGFFFGGGGEGSSNSFKRERRGNQSLLKEFEGRLKKINRQ